MRPRFTWDIGRRTLALGERTLLMGVVNVTPDSFSDGGRYCEPERAIAHGLMLLDQGADILDIGGESTRPGARVAPPENVSGPPRTSGTGAPARGRSAVTAEQELTRVLPVIRGIKDRAPHAVLSIDTYKAAVATEAVGAGAEIVNDVSALRWDAAMARTVAGLGCGLVLMHMRGRPEEWRTLPPLDGDALLRLVCRDLAEAEQTATAAGIRRDRVVLDPGFGFGKNYDENYPLLARLDQLHVLGFPLLAGTSRKSFIGKTAARGGPKLPPDQRLSGTLATVTAAILKGAHIVRVHDVAEAAQAAAIADAVLPAHPR
jgi:dihydropteroate synthase